MSETNVERELGVISTTLVQILRDLESAKAAQAAQSEKLEEALRITADLQRDMSAIKPVVAELSRWKLLGLGAVMGVGAIGAVFGVSMAVARDAILHALGFK